MHVVMLPWLAFGHILPFTELAKRIARHGHRVTLLSTPRNTRRLIGDVPPDLAGLLRVTDVPLPRVDGLPEAAEATVDLPSDDLRPLLRRAFDAAFAAALADVLRGPAPRRPDWVLIDYAAYWAPAAAAAHGVPCAFLSLFSAAALGFIGPPEALMGGGGKHAKTKPEHFTAVPEYVPFPTTVAFRRHEAREKLKPAGLAHHDGSGVSEAYRFGKSIEGSRLVGIRSSTAFEPEWLRLLGELYRKPVIPLGLLPPQRPTAQGAANAGHEATLRWLDGHAPGSVVYVAFGSEAKLTSAQLRAVALGLEASGLPFLWAFRAAPAPASAETAGEDTDATTGLPAGFEERVTGGRGLVCRGWVPQIMLLAHGSVGGFLTHAGWGSVVEGLALGVRLALLPLMFDQGLNARHLVEKKIGVEVARDEEDGSFDARDVADALRRVMAEDDGGEDGYGAKVKELAQVFGNEEASEGNSLLLPGEPAPTHATVDYSWECFRVAHWPEYYKQQSTYTDPGTFYTPA